MGNSAPGGALPLGFELAAGTAGEDAWLDGWTHFGPSVGPQMGPARGVAAARFRVSKAAIYFN